MSVAYGPIPLLEQQYGTAELWEWTKEWLEMEAASDEENEHVELLEYLMICAAHSN